MRWENLTLGTFINIGYVERVDKGIGNGNYEAMGLYVWTEGFWLSLEQVGKIYNK